MPKSEKDKSPEPKKTSGKKSRGLTSGQLRSKASDATPKKALSAADKREITIQLWARGASDPIVLAFAAEHAGQRTVKRPKHEWNRLFAKFKTAPRG
jgi:hypothetical protein